MRESLSNGTASAGSGAYFAAAYSAPSDDAPTRKLRREKGFEGFFMGISKNLEEAYWFHMLWATTFWWRRLSPVAFSPCKFQRPQAKACATLRPGRVLEA